MWLDAGEKVPLDVGENVGVDVGGKVAVANQATRTRGNIDCVSWVKS